MTDYGYDAAFFQPAELVASGCVVVFVYTDGTHAYSAADVAKIHEVKPIVFNHENAQTELAGGYAAGALAAKHAVAAVIAYGAPTDGSVAILYSVDLNVAAGSFAPYRAAFDGINDYHGGRFKTGVYGEGALIDDLTASGRVQAKGWLSASSSFPGHKVNDAHVGAYQQVGSDIPSTDRDVITDLPGLAPWWAAGTSPSGGGTPLGDDMPLTPADYPIIEGGVGSTPIVVGSGTQPLGVVLSALLANVQTLLGLEQSETNAITAVAAAVNALKVNPGSVDEATLAADLAASLTASLPASFVAALAAKLGASS